MKTSTQLALELAEAKAREEQEDRESRKAQSEAWQVLRDNPDNWEWECKVIREQVWPKDEWFDGVRVSRRMKPEVLAEWRKGGFPTFSDDYQRPDQWFGMVYKRTAENILTHTGGGHLVLNDPMLCNDDEWAAILAGNIPLKYRK